MQWSAEQNSYVDDNGSPIRRGGGSGRSSLIWRAVAFLAVFCVLQLTWESLRGTSIEQLVVHDGTARPAAFLANIITPDVHARAVAFAIRAPGGGLRILNGCEGVEALFLLMAALLVADIPWKARWLGLAFGVPLVFVINQARILGLFYAYRKDPDLFETLHGIVAPVVVVLLIALYFYGWLSHAAPRDAKPA